MKKSILLVITILMMIFGINSVYADTCLSEYNVGYTPLLNQTKTLSLGQNVFDIDLQNSITFKNDYNYLKSQMWYVISDTNSMISNINLETTCTQSHLENMAPTMTITYADGTRSQVAGSTYESICDSWQTRQVNQTLLIGNEPNISTIGMAIMNKASATPIMCSVDLNGNFNCPKPYNNYNFDVIRFYFSLEKQSQATIKFGWFTRVPYWCQNDTQQIINNQNQNTTSINNNITNLNDNIINSSISSETTSGVDNISSNNINSDSKNVVLDFMLMPITFIQNILNSFGNSCATLCLGNCGSGHDNEWRFVFPCIDVKSFIGDTIYNTIDVLMCFGMIFAFLRSVVNFLKKALMLESDISSEVRIF